MKDIVFQGDGAPVDKPNSFELKQVVEILVPETRRPLDDFLDELEAVQVRQRGEVDSSSPRVGVVTLREAKAEEVCAKLERGEIEGERGRVEGLHESEDAELREEPGEMVEMRLDKPALEISTAAAAEPEDGQARRKAGEESHVNHGSRVKDICEGVRR